MLPADVAGAELLVDAADLPDGWAPLLERVRGLRGEDLTRFLPPADGGRASAVLVLVGDGGPGAPAAAGPDVVLTLRAAGMRSHPGQVSFPGGATDPGDDGPVATAFREAAEETGLDPSSAVPVAVLPGLWLPPSGFVVRPVLAWWRDPHPLHAREPEEVEQVRRVALADLADPARRWTAQHPSGWTGPAFDLDDLLLWGFTAGLVSRLLQLAGLERPWDASVRRELPAAMTDGWRRAVADDPEAAERVAAAARELSAQAGAEPGATPLTDAAGAGDGGTAGP